jgi:hypothetical protein
VGCHDRVRDADDRAAISAYLDKGGRVLLTGNRVLDSITTVGSPQTPADVPAFGAHYFGVRSPEGNTSYIVSQFLSSVMTGAGLLDGVDVTSHPSPARQFVGLAGLSDAGTGFTKETIAPFGKASAIFSPDQNLLGAVTQESDAPEIGVAVDGDEAHGSFKSAVLGWNLGDDSDAGQTVAALQKILGHFGVDTAGSPLQQSKRLIYTSAVRDSVSGRAVPVTAVVLGGKGEVTPVLHYRRHDLGGFYTVDMKPGAAPHTWVAAVPGKAVTPDGVDYYITAGRTRSPFGAKHLFHSVAVAMPMVAKPMPPKG